MALRPWIRWPYVVALLLAMGWGASASVRRDRVEGEVLAYTECSFRGPPRVVIRPDLAPPDTLPVRVHERVHAEQCRALGPVRYRLRNLTASGKLSLEVPAYCAAAQARLAASGHWESVRARMFDDIVAALHGVVDSALVARTVSRDCPIMSVRVSRA
jgi:hypothetical protein